MGKIKWVDFMRGLGIFLVMLGHSLPGDSFIKVIIYGFHMPLFFFVSGFLYSDKNTKMSCKDYFIKLIKAYIKPYFIISFVCLCLTIIRYYAVKDPLEISQIKKYFIGIGYSLGSMTWTSYWGAVWFLTALFCAMNIFHLIMKINRPAIQVLIISICVAVSYCLSVIGFKKLPWNFDTAMMAQAFIAFGYLYRNTILPKINDLNNAIKSCIVLVSLAIGVFCIIKNPVDLVAFVSNYYGNLVLMIIGAICMVVAIQIICEFVCNILPETNVLIKVVCWMGAMSLLLMGYHYICKVYVEDVFILLGTEPVWYFAFPIEVIICSLFILAYKKLSKILFQRKIKSPLN